MERRRVVTEVDGGTCYNIHELTAGSHNYRFKKTSMASVILCLHTSIMYFRIPNIKPEHFQTVYKKERGEK